MRARTPGRAAQERAYLKRNKELLTEGQPCAAREMTLRWPSRTVECRGMADTVQHARGRRGAALLDERFWLFLCWPCHEWVERHPADATALGLRLSRVFGVAS